MEAGEKSGRTARRQKIVLSVRAEEESVVVHGVDQVPRHILVGEMGRIDGVEA